MLDNLELIKVEYKKHLFRVERENARGECGYINFRKEVDKQRRKLLLETPALNFYGSEALPIGENFMSANDDCPRLEENIPFLEFLLYKRMNGVASAGMTQFSSTDFAHLLKKKKFMQALKNLIKFPDYDAFNTFSDVFKASLPEGSKFPNIIVNRTACACSRSLSIFPDQGKFKTLFKWLTDAGIITPPEESLKWDWYTQNIYCVQAFKKILEVGDSDYEMDTVTSFFWFLYDLMILNNKVKELEEEEAKGVNIKEEKKPNNSNIKDIVKAEVERLGEYADLNHIDVSEVTDMSSLFEDVNFDGDISKWDVSKVTNMARMFYETGFSQDISAWNVSSVKNMEEMFAESYFDGDISKWDVSNVENMASMFAYSNFNGELASWNVGKVANMQNMFSFASFSGKLTDWNVSNVTDMQSMFEETSFDCDISNWDISKVKDFTNMFLGSTNFNHDLSKWQIKEGQVIDNMFADSPAEDNAPSWYK